MTTLLHHLVWKEPVEIDVIRDLIEVYGPDVPDREGYTPLICSKNLEICQLLLDMGANIDAVNGYGETSLHRCRDLEKVKFLVERGADVNARDNHGRTPLHLAKNLEIIRVLIDHGADVNAVDANGKSVINNQFSTFARRSMTPIEPELLVWQEKCQILLNHGFDAGLSTGDGYTNSNFAELLDHGWIDFCQELVDRGFDCSAYDGQGNTVMVYIKNPISVHFLVDNGVDINAPIDRRLNNTALHICCDEQMICVLLKYGADPRVRNAAGNTVLMNRIGSNIAGVSDLKFIRIILECPFEMLGLDMVNNGKTVFMITAETMNCNIRNWRMLVKLLCHVSDRAVRKELLGNHVPGGAELLDLCLLADCGVVEDNETTRAIMENDLRFPFEHVTLVQASLSQSVEMVQLLGESILGPLTDLLVWFINADRVDMVEHLWSLKPDDWMKNNLVDMCVTSWEMLRVLKLPFDPWIVSSEWLQRQLSRGMTDEQLLVKGGLVSRQVLEMRAQRWEWYKVFVLGQGWFFDLPRNMVPKVVLFIR